MTNLRKNVGVFIQDQTTEIIDLHVTQKIQDIDIVTNTSIDDVAITVSSAAEPTNGSTVCLREGSAFYQGQILSHVANGDNWDITLDTPLDYAYTTAGGCEEASIDLNVNGSVTKQVFEVSPKGLDEGIKWDIVRFMVQINDASAMDDGKFGGATALTNGIVFRKVDGITKNLFNAKTNGDLAAHMYDVAYVDNTVGPSGLYGLRGRRTFGGQSKNGVVIRLSSETSDAFQIIVQDDLTVLDSFQIIAQGHIVED